MSFYYIDTINHNHELRQYFRHSSLLPLSLPDITITSSPFFYFSHLKYPALNIYNTSGARDTILMNFSDRNSLVTGPNIRVPTGLSCLSSKTAALPSKRIKEPSGLLTPFFVLTTTASKTSPFFTFPRGIASFIVTLITSPMPAYLRLEPPKNFYTHQPSSTTIIGSLQNCLHLDHLFIPPIQIFSDF